MVEDSESPEAEGEIHIRPKNDYPGTALPRKRRRTEPQFIKKEHETDEEGEEDTKIGVGSKFLSHVSPSAPSKPEDARRLQNHICFEFRNEYHIILVTLLKAIGH